MTQPLVLRCTGREVDDELQPVGEPCGRVFKRPVRILMGNERPVASWVGCMPVPIDDAGYVNHARAAGWAVGPDGAVCCPSCRRPSKLRDLTVPLFEA